MNTSLISLKQCLRGKWLFLTLGLIFAITSSLQATTLFSDNFDSYANGTADAAYKANYAGASGAPTFVITNGGLSGSKSFQATGDGTLIRTNVPINLAAGPATIDVYFQRGTAGQAASPQIGVMTNFTGALNTSESVGGRFNNLEALDVRSTFGGAQNSVGTAPGATLTTGNWYFLRGIITSNAAANTLTVVLQLFNSDSAGVVGTGIVTNTQNNVTNASVYGAAAKLYAAVRLSGNTGVTNMDNFSVSQASAGPPPSITGAATATAFTTTYGTASANQSFSVSGANLTANLVATAATGFEVATSSGGTYGSSVSFTPSGGSASGTVYLRLAATATVSGTYNGVNAVVLSSAGATSQNIVAASTGNTVSARVLTFTGSKTFDGNASATAAQLTFANNVDGGNLTMSGSVTLAGASAGSQSITSFSGLTLGGSAAGNYTLTGASGTVTVNAAPPSITGAATATAFTTTYGAASTAQGFSVSGANLTADLVATAATGFEVANGAGAYGATATFTQTGGSASGTLNLRLKANAAVSGTYNSVNAAVLSSGAATPVNITTASSGNTVSVRVLTFTGSKTYDSSASATAAQLTFGNNVDAGNLTMSGSVTLAGASAGSQSITSFSGLTLGGSAAGNYTLTGASGTVTIGARALTFTGSKTYDGVASATAAQLTFGNNLDGGNLTMSGSVTLSSANVGSPAISSFAGLTLGGSAVGNYTLTGASGTVTVGKATPGVTVTVGTYTYTGSAQGPNTFSTSPAGDTGTATWEYVGVSGTSYGPSATRPTAVGNYTAQVTALTADSNFNSSSSSATAFTIANVNVFFTDNYTVSVGSVNIDFENMLGREAGSLFPLSYLTRYTGGSAFLQQVGSTSSFTTTTNVLFMRGDAGVRIDNDFSTVGAPVEIKWSVIMNWFGFPNTNSLIIGSRSDGYDPTNAAFAFQLRRDGATSIFTNGVASAGTSGTNFGENVLVDYKVILSDTAGTGSPFGSGGSKASYYQSGTLLGTATLGQLTAGQGYVGFIGGVGNVGIDNLQIGSVSPASITLTGPLGAVNTFVGNVSPTPTTFTVSGTSLTGNLTVTPPAGFEVSLSSGSGYTTSLPITASGTLAGTTVYVRLAATTALGSYYGNITVVGGGDAKTIATALSTVSKAPSSVTYGGTVSFTYNGAAQTPGITGIAGSTGTRTTNYVGTGYASVNPPTNAGSYYLSNTVASDANYNGVTNSLSFTINKATASVTVTPYSVTYDGIGHTATAGTVSGVNGETGATVGTVNLSGTTHTTAGSYASDSWTLTGGANYNSIGATTISNNIVKATPVVSWSNPADIAYGTALSGTQLNATAGGVAGNFVYTPASGTVLSVGNGQTLSVQFTPTDAADYNTPSAKTVSINVNPVITASAGSNGSISPSGTTTVSYGGNQTYAITADSLYNVSDVLVDGGSVGAITTYTFSSVTAPHTISASFVLACSAPGIVGGLDATATNLCAGNPVILTLTNATGTSPLAYQWQTNGTTILNATNASYTNSSASDTWDYACVVTNACGSITSSVVTVAVNPTPATTTISGSTTVIHGSTHAYSVTATGGSSYGWTLPAGASYTGGLDNSINVTFGTTGGNVTVTETNASDCTGTPQTLAVTVAANTAPTANTMNVLRTPGEPLVIALSDLATNWNDADGDLVQMTAFNGVTSNGMNLTPLYLTFTNGAYLTSAGGLLGYTNTANVNDQFTYSLGDGFGGTNIGYVNIVVSPFVAGTQTISGQQTTNVISGSSFTVTYYGIPGYTYLLERSTNLTDWVGISTNTIGSGGVTNVIDSFSGLPGVPSSAYYRVGWQPSY